MESKSRSPEHRQINLNEGSSPAKIRMIYEKEHTHKANREVLARDMGYTGCTSFGNSDCVIEAVQLT